MNFKVKTHNAIAESGLTMLTEASFSVSEEENDPDALAPTGANATAKRIASLEAQISAGIDRLRDLSTDPNWQCKSDSGTSWPGQVARRARRRPRCEKFRTLVYY